MPKVLVADDDMLIRRFLEEALHVGGFDVVSACDGAEAIKLVDETSDWDVVVTDYQMPRATGIEVIAHALRVDPSLPCVIVTAFHDLDLAVQGMQAGAVGFIPKPFKSHHLLTVVQRALDRRQLATETIRLRLLAPMLERFTLVLANTLETKDLGTQRHCERLIGLSDALAERLGLDETSRAAVRLGACLHDIGKVGVPEHILRKPGRLTDAEFDAVREHPEIGAAILGHVDTWQEVRLIVRHHHERFGGGGYPSGLRGAEIPLGARIVCVADAFDVMRAGRPYAPPRFFDEIVSEMHQQSGRQFDPDVVRAFLDVVGDADATHEDEPHDLRATLSAVHPARSGSWLLPDTRAPSSGTISA